MSTYWGYVCDSHDPPLISERWFNHGEEVLIDVFRKERAGEWPMDMAYPLLEDPMPVVWRNGYETTAPIRWLRKHPHCTVNLHSEYGERQKL